jgi:hypothetical protein
MSATAQQAKLASLLSKARQRTHASLADAEVSFMEMLLDRLAAVESSLDALSKRNEALEQQVTTLLKKPALRLTPESGYMAFTDGKMLFWELEEGPRIYDPAEERQCRREPLTHAHMNAIVSDARIDLQVLNLALVSLAGPVTFRMIYDVVMSLSPFARAGIAHWIVEDFAIVSGRVCPTFRKD